MVKSLIELDQEFVWHPFTQTGRAQSILAVVAAKQSTLVLDDGREIIDGISSWWCNLHGHSHPSISSAIANQAATLGHVLFAGCTHEPAVKLASELIALLPINHKKVFFSDNGSTAVEVALKMSVQYWHNVGERRPVILALRDDYHGDTFGAMAVGERGFFSAPFEEHLFSVEFLSTSGTDEMLEKCRQLCKLGNVGAFIFEPTVQGAAGMLMYGTSVLDAYMAICHEFGVLCIADEVMTGFGRTGPLFVSGQFKNPPDMICLSKGITSGTLPLAVTTCTREISDAFISNDHSRTFLHGHTYTANPIACAAARASLQLTTSFECESQRSFIAQSHLVFSDLLRKRRDVENIRTSGTILAFNVKTSEAIGYSNSVGEILRPLFISRGVLLRPLGNVVYIMPPYCISEEELRTIYGAIEYALDNLASGTYNVAV